MKAALILYRSEQTRLGAIILTAVVLIALGAPWLAPADPYAVDPAARLLPPLSAAAHAAGAHGLQRHLLGTDSVGRDTLSRLIYGGRVSLAAGFLAVLISAVVGSLVGALSGYFGGWLEIASGWFIDVQLSFPFLLLAIFLLGALGGGTVGVVLVLALATWVNYARIVRSQVLSIRHQTYVEAARALGAGEARVLFLHVLPNAMATRERRCELLDGAGHPHGGVIEFPRRRTGSLDALLGHHAQRRARLPAVGLVDRHHARHCHRRHRVWRALARRGSARAARSARPAVSASCLLAVEELSISIRAAHTTRLVVSAASFAVARGETLGIVGESGSGKSLTMLSLLQLLPDSAQAQAARATFEERPLLRLSRRELESVRGRQIAFVFQDPLAALNPLRSIGAQIGEVARRHFGLSRAQCEQRAAELLGQVGIADAHERLRHYPHEFSGGQRQRITIAMALAGEPQLLIADEPTTALDVTVQAEIVKLIKAMQRDRHMTVIWVTHDLALLARLADRVIVMHRGKVVEQADISTLFRAPQHPHTRELLASLRRNQLRTVPDPAAPAPPVLLAARALGVRYQRAGRSLQALADIDLSIHEGETLAVVGESGSGKSTLARALIGLVAPSEGGIWLRGVSLDTRTARVPRAIRRQLQMVFQDPFSSLNPRRTVGAAIAEPLIVHRLAQGAQLKRRVAECLTLVGLDPAVAPRFPHEFSGGQRQRVCIARAIACEPTLIVADEALSALDLTLQAQMLALLAELKQRYALTYLFISHDLSVVECISDRVAVLYLGRMVELAPTTALYAHPRHPYTRALLAAVPVADPEYERSHPYQSLAGEPPSAASPPAGCAFHSRCPRARSRCQSERPALAELAPGHAVACHYPH